MASTIKIKRSSVPNKIPTTSDIATGELAINTKDRKIYSSNGNAVFSFTSDYLQVANAVATYTTKASPTTSGVLAHTGHATISTNLTVSGNTVIGKLVANGSLGTSGYALKSNGSTVYWDAVGSGAGGGSSGASWAALTSTNTAIRTLVSDRLQVANAAAIYQTKAVERSALANTNLAITNVKTGLTTTNTAIRLLVSDRLQVANAVILYASKYDSQYLLTGTTTNATETELLIGGVSRVSVTSGKTAYYTIDIVARRTDTTGDHAAFRLQGVVNNNGGTVIDIGSIFETIIYRSNANYMVDARADNTNDSINIYVTGVAGHTLSWRAIITIMQV